MWSFIQSWYNYMCWLQTEHLFICRFLCLCLGQMQKPELSIKLTNPIRLHWPKRSKVFFFTGVKFIYTHKISSCQCEPVAARAQQTLFVRTAAELYGVEFTHEQNDFICTDYVFLVDDFWTKYNSIQDGVTRWSTLQQPTQRPKRVGTQSGCVPQPGGTGKQPSRLPEKTPMYRQ